MFDRAIHVVRPTVRVANTYNVVLVAASTGERIFGPDPSFGKYFPKFALLAKSRLVYPPQDPRGVRTPREQFEDGLTVEEWYDYMDMGLE